MTTQTKDDHQRLIQITRHGSLSPYGTPEQIKYALTLCKRLKLPVSREDLQQMKARDLDNVIKTALDLLKEKLTEEAEHFTPAERRTTYSRLQRNRAYGERKRA